VVRHRTVASVGLESTSVTEDNEAVASADADPHRATGPRDAAAERQVAVVVTGIETYGIRTFLLTQLRHAAQSGMRFSYLAAEDGDCAEALRTAGATVEVAGGKIQVHYPGHPMLVPVAWLWQGPGFYRAYRGIKRSLRRTRYDIVYVHSFYGSLIARLAALGTGCRVVVHLHNILNERRLAGLQRVLMSLALAAAADRLVAISAFPASSLWGPARRKVERIDNGIDIRAIAETVRDVAEEPRRITVIGRLVDWKKQDLAIRAVDVLRARGVDCELEIIGGRGHTDSPDYERAIRALVTKLGIADRVQFAGAVSPPYRRLAAAAVCVGCATREPFGLVVLEAAACGTAVAAAGAGAMTELIEDGKTGVLFRPDDPVSLADVLQRLLGDAALRASLAEAARRRALERYGIATHLNALRACFDGVLSRA
jgi:glycosyltransferase involved in cell wall biosynthesis